MSPCLLVLEDIDTIVTSQTRSYFFNEVDGLENNDGIMMVASTNHMDRLDPGLSNRPSRFDRKCLFPLPSKAERIQYVQFWREKLKPKSDVKFPEVLVEPIAGITHDFSFAYMQEAFVSTLLDIAHRHDEEDEDGDDGPLSGGGGDDDLEKYELWRVMKEQVKMLREEMDDTTPAGDANATSPTSDFQAPSSDDPREYGNVTHAGPGDMRSLCQSCAASPDFSSIHNPSASQRPNADRGVTLLPLSPLLTRPECHAYNEFTNRLQELAFFPNGSSSKL